MAQESKRYWCRSHVDLNFLETKPCIEISREVRLDSYNIYSTLLTF